MAKQRPEMAELDLFEDCERIIEAAMTRLAVRFGGELSEDERRGFAHNAYVAMLEKHVRGDVIRSPIAYAQRAAVNRVIDARRYGAGRYEGVTDPSDAVFRGPSQVAGPEESTLAHIDVARGVVAAETLPAEERSVYRAVEHEGQKVGDAAERLGVSVSTAETRLSRARAHAPAAPG